MKLSEATYFPDAKELTRHGFVSHMEDFVGKLIGDNPLGADVDDYLKDFDIDAKKALEILTKPEIDDMPESAVVMRTERIKNGGTDEFGKPMKDEFQVIYKVPKKDMANGIKGIDEKLRNLYIKLFENHIVEGTVLTEDGEGGMGGDGGAMEGMGGATTTFTTGNYSYDANALGKKKSGKQDEEKGADTDFPILRRDIYKVTESKKKMKRPIGRLTMFITEEQMQQLAQLIKEDEFGGGALTTNNVGVDGSPKNWQYDVPFGAKSKNDPSLDHDGIFDKEKNKPAGHDGRSVKESKSGIHIKKSHEGDLTDLKKRTGKTESEIYNDGNPDHKKMVVFARNARKWNKK